MWSLDGYTHRQNLELIVYSEARRRPAEPLPPIPVSLHYRDLCRNSTATCSYSGSAVTCHKRPHRDTRLVFKLRAYKKLHTVHLSNSWNAYTTMATTTEPEFILYDLACTKDVCFSPAVWRVRLLLNYKGISYKTVFLEFPDIEPTLKGL